MGKLVVFFLILRNCQFEIGVGISLTDKEIYIAHGQIFEIRIFWLSKSLKRESQMNLLQLEN